MRAMLKAGESRCESELSNSHIFTWRFLHSSINCVCRLWNKAQQPFGDFCKRGILLNMGALFFDNRNQFDKQPYFQAKAGAKVRIVEPKTGTKRIKKWFAIMPVTIISEIDGQRRYETRQFEFVKVEQEYGGLLCNASGWANIRFIDD